jgi:hypothetical protein
MRLTANLQLESPLLTQPQALRSALAKIVRETAFEVEADIKERMRSPKSGRTYRRGVLTRKATKGTRSLGLRERTTKSGARLAIVGSRIHRASAPGEAPAVDTGQLINSISTQVDDLHASVSTPLQKAIWLEEGTRKIAPRPSFEPAATDAREKFEARCDAAVKELL